MSVTKKLTKHGNSYALIIERPILELLGISSDTLLNISTPDGASIVVTPINKEISEKDLNQSIAKANKKYGRALKRLAE